MKKFRGALGILGLTSVLATTLAGCGAPAPEAVTPSQSSFAPATSEASTPVETPSKKPTPETTPPRGIIVLTGQTTESFGPTGEFIGTTISEIDPLTGAARVIADYSATSGRTQEIERMNSGGAVIRRALFSPDFQLAVAVREAADGTSHVGWVDTQNNFTDVSENVAGSSDDFSSTVTHDTPMFGADGSFYFAARVPGSSGFKSEPTIMKTTIENPTKVTEYKKLAGVNYFVNPDGNAVSVCAGCSTFVENGTPGLGGTRVDDWINGMEFISTSTSGTMIYRSKATSVDDQSTGGPGTPLIPETNRKVSSPVVSPDGTNVAFLSSNTQGTVDLFIVPATGGSPKKVAMSPTLGPLAEKNVLLAWK